MSAMPPGNAPSRSVTEVARVFLTRKREASLKPMGLRRADMVISFSLLGKARHHRIRSRLAGVRLVFKCRNLELNAFPMDGDPPSKVGYRRATGKYMLTSRFTADDPNLPSGTTAANGRDGGLLSFAGARANGEVAPKPAVPLSWVERVNRQRRH